jgi:hypothetical protein
MLLHVPCCQLLQVPAYLKRNKQQIAQEQQQLEQYMRLREQPVSSAVNGGNEQQFCSGLH